MDKNHNWSKRFIQVLQHWQEELRKTTKIGKKMILASKTNSDLHDLYEDLGKKVYFSLKEKSLDSEDPIFQDFVKKIDELQKDNLIKKLLKLPKEFLNLSKQLLPE